MSHSELMAIQGSKSSGSLQLLPISEAELADSSQPCNERKGEEEEDGQGVRRRSAQETTRTCRMKEEKDHLNYETKQSMSRSVSVDRGSRSSVGRLETAEVAIQVNSLFSCLLLPSTFLLPPDLCLLHPFSCTEGPMRPRMRTLVRMQNEVPWKGSDRPQKT